MRELSIVDLDAESGDLLPAREALGLFNWNYTEITAANNALALNVGSLTSAAVASAGQSITVVTN